MAPGWRSIRLPLGGFEGIKKQDSGFQKAQSVSRFVLFSGDAVRKAYQLAVGTEGERYSCHGQHLARPVPGSLIHRVLDWDAWHNKISSPYIIDASLEARTRFLAHIDPRRKHRL